MWVGYALACPAVARGSPRAASPHDGDRKLKHTPPLRALGQQLSCRFIPPTPPRSPLLYSLQLVKSARPILPQQPRQRAVRQQFPARLAGGAVIRLIRGVADALHFGAAARAWLAVTPMDGHAVAERRDLLRKSA